MKDHHAIAALRFFRQQRAAGQFHVSRVRTDGKDGARNGRRRNGDGHRNQESASKHYDFGAGGAGGGKYANARAEAIHHWPPLFVMTDVTCGFIVMVVPSGAPMPAISRS